MDTVHLADIPESAQILLNHVLMDFVEHWTLYQYAALIFMNYGIIDIFISTNALCDNGYS